MTEEILKELDEIKNYEFGNIVAANMTIQLLEKSLRVAVVGLDEIESLATLETRAIQLRTWDMQEQIAAILGVEETARELRKKFGYSDLTPDQEADNLEANIEDEIVKGNE